MDNLLPILSLDNKDVLDSLGIVGDVLDGGCDPLHSPDQVEGGLGAGRGDGVVQGRHAAGLRLCLHVLEDVDDTVGLLLLLHLLEHELAHLGQLLDHAELAGQLGRVNDLAWWQTQGLNTGLGIRGFQLKISKTSIKNCTKMLNHKNNLFLMETEDMWVTFIDIFEINTEYNDNDDNNNTTVIDTFYGTYESLMRIDSSILQLLAFRDHNQNWKFNILLIINSILILGECLNTTDSCVQ